MMSSSTTNRRRRAVEAANATKAPARPADIHDIHVARLMQAGALNLHCTGCGATTAIPPTCAVCYARS